MYTLFTADNCHQCSQAVNIMDKYQVSYRIVNVDQSEERPPIRIYAFPALFDGDQLLAYGVDIERIVKKKPQTDV